MPLSDGGAAIGAHGCLLLTKLYDAPASDLTYGLNPICDIDTCIRAIKYTADSGPNGEVFYEIQPYCINPDEYLAGNSSFKGAHERIYGNHDYADYDAEKDIYLESKNAVCFSGKLPPSNDCRFSLHEMNWFE